MKDKFLVNSLKPFIDTSGLTGEEEVDRKRFSSKITISPEEEKTCTALITTLDEDAEHDVIIPSGVDLKRFSKNPVVMYAHNYSSKPVAKIIALSIEENGILAKMTFADTTEANDVWTLIKGGFINANSIGFIIREKFIKGTEEFDKYLKEAKIKVKDTVKRIISKFELLENSIVPLPCNPEALMVAISSKSILLSDKTIKELELPKELPKELPVIKEEVKEEVKELPKEESYGELIDIKPYPHEHAARQTSPDKYVRFRRQNNKFAAGLHAIFGITSDGTVELQSIRADSSKYTVEKFKEWLEKNNFKTNIEPAKEKAYIKVIRSGNEPAKRYMKIVRSGNYNLKEYIEIYKKHKSGKII